VIGRAREQVCKRHDFLPYGGFCRSLIDSYQAKNFLNNRLFFLLAECRQVNFDDGGAITLT
jgi:hypothetical protein